MQGRINWRWRWIAMLRPMRGKYIEKPVSSRKASEAVADKGCVDRGCQLGVIVRIEVLTGGRAFSLVGDYIDPLASASNPAPQTVQPSSPFGADCSNLAAASIEHFVQVSKQGLEPVQGLPQLRQAEISALLYEKLCRAITIEAARASRQRRHEVFDLLHHLDA